MGWRAIFKQAVITASTMLALNLIAANSGGQIRQVIKGEAGLLTRLGNVFTGG